jgi:YHS domain-containing protein
MTMKTTSKALLGILLLSGAVLFAQPSTQESRKPVNTKCAVMPQDDVDPKHTYEYKGKLIGFCCEDCIPEFKKDPEKYMKNLK